MSASGTDPVIFNCYVQWTEPQVVRHTASKIHPSTQGKAGGETQNSKYSRTEQDRQLGTVQSIPTARARQVPFRTRITAADFLALHADSGRMRLMTMSAGSRPPCRLHTGLFHYESTTRGRGDPRASADAQSRDAIPPRPPSGTSAARPLLQPGPEPVAAGFALSLSPHTGDTWR